MCATVRLLPVNAEFQREYYTPRKLVDELGWEINPEDFSKGFQGDLPWNRCLCVLNDLDELALRNIKEQHFEDGPMGDINIWPVGIEPMIEE